MSHTEKNHHLVTFIVYTPIFEPPCTVCTRTARTLTGQWFRALIIHLLSRAADMQMMLLYIRQPVDWSLQTSLPIVQNQSPFFTISLDRHVPLRGDHGRKTDIKPKKSDSNPVLRMATEMLEECITCVSIVNKKRRFEARKKCLFGWLPLDWTQSRLAPFLEQLISVSNFVYNTNCILRTVF